MYASIPAAMDTASPFDSVMSSSDDDLKNPFMLFLPEEDELRLDRHHCLTRFPDVRLWEMEPLFGELHRGNRHAKN